MKTTKDIESWRLRKGENSLSYIVRLSDIVGSTTLTYWKYPRMLVIQIHCNTGMDCKIRKEIPVELTEMEANIDNILCTALEEAAFEIIRINRRSHD